MSRAPADQVSHRADDEAAVAVAAAAPAESDFSTLSRVGLAPSGRLRLTVIAWSTAIVASALALIMLLNLGAEAVGVDLFRALQG